MSDPAQADALHGGIDPDDVHLAERGRSAAWSSGSRRSRPSRSATISPVGVEPRLGHPLGQVGGVHRPLLGVVREGQRVDADQVLGVGVAVGPQRHAVGHDVRPGTAPSATVASPRARAPARTRRLAASLRAAGWSRVRPGARGPSGPGRRAPSSSSDVPRPCPRESGCTTRLRVRSVTVANPNSSVHVSYVVPIGVAEGEPGGLVERRRPVGLLRGGGEQGDPVQGHGRHSRPERPGAPPMADLPRVSCTSHGELSVGSDNFTG